MKNIKNTEKNKSSRFIILVSCVIVLILLFGFIYYRSIILDTSPSQEAVSSSYTGEGDSINLDPPTEEDKKEVEENKIQIEEKAKQTDRQNTSTTSKKVEISSVSVSENKSIVAQTKLYGAGWGSCELSIKQGDQIITTSAESLYQADFSTCLGFSVPYEQFNRVGIWAVSLSVKNSDGNIYSATEKTVEVL